MRFKGPDDFQKFVNLTFFIEDPIQSTAMNGSKRRFVEAFDCNRAMLRNLALQHGKELGLRDLVPMQILLVVGIFPAGIAARQGGTHVLLWLLSVALLLLPTAGLVQYCVRIWPYEGGVYQWASYSPYFGSTMRAVYQMAELRSASSPPPEASTPPRHGRPADFAGEHFA